MIQSVQKGFRGNNIYFISIIAVSLPDYAFHWELSKEVEGYIRCDKIIWEYRHTEKEKDREVDNETWREKENTKIFMYAYRPY